MNSASNVEMPSKTQCSAVLDSYARGQVCLEKSRGELLGVDAALITGIVRTIHPHGVLSRFNAAHPELAVQPGDVLPSPAA